MTNTKDWSDDEGVVRLKSGLISLREGLRDFLGRVFLRAAKAFVGEVKTTKPIPPHPVQSQSQPTSDRVLKIKKSTYRVNHSSP